MRKDKPSRIAYKVGVNIISLGSKPWLSSIRPEELTGFLHETGWIHLPEAEGTGKHGVEYFGVATK